MDGRKALDEAVRVRSTTTEASLGLQAMATSRLDTSKCDGTRSRQKEMDRVVSTTEKPSNRPLCTPLTTAGVCFPSSTIQRTMRRL